MFVIIGCVQGSQTSDRVVHQLQSRVDVLLGHFFSEVEFGHGLRDSDDAEEGSWRNIHVRNLFSSFSLELPLFYILGYNVVMKVMRNGRIEGLGMCNERSHNLSIDLLVGLFRSIQLLMHLSDMHGQVFIQLLVGLIQKEENQVESG